MNSIDFQFEELLVAVAIGLPLHRLDLVVRPLQGTRRDRVVIPRYQAQRVFPQRLGQTSQERNARSLCPCQPIQQEDRRLVLVVLLPEFPQLLLEVIGRRQRFVQLQSFVQTFPLLPRRVQVFRPFHQQPTHPLEYLPVFRGGLVVQLPSQLRQLVI